jgi:hypothetical protein
MLQNVARDDLALQEIVNSMVSKTHLDRRDMRKVLQQVGNSGKFLLLLLDDFDTIFSNHSVKSKYTLFGLRVSGR